MNSIIYLRGETVQMNSIIYFRGRTVQKSIRAKKILLYYATFQFKMIFYATGNELVL